MKKIVLLIVLIPFIFAFQCDSETEPCGNFVEFQKPDLVTIENPQETYELGDVLWLTSEVDRNQFSTETGASIDLFQSNNQLYYYIDLQKSSAYNGYFYLYLNENTTIIEHGEMESNNVILVQEGNYFKSKIGIKLLEPGTYSINIYNIASFNPNQVGCNFTAYSMITDFNGLDSNLFTFEVN